MFFDEYYYRLARIESKLNYFEEQVIAKYQKSYDLGRKSSNYYAPMSALQIGLIYENKKDYKKALIYFERCLSLSDFDYERGIHQKAKVSLSRLTN
jgi:tetratricopeptide (TPR) repeat protein